MSTITEIQEAIEKLPSSEKSALAAWLQSKDEPIMSEAEETALLARLDKAAGALSSAGLAAANSEPPNKNKPSSGQSKILKQEYSQPRMSVILRSRF